MVTDRMDDTAASPFPDLVAIAKLVTYAERRRALADAMRFFCGTEPDAVLLDHQMHVAGEAALHGGLFDPGERLQAEANRLG